MKHWGLVLICLALLAGCGVPVPVRVAWGAADGISMPAPRRSVSEHGISLLADKDCSFLRGVRGDSFCVDAPASIAVAEADPAAAEAEAKTLATFATAAGVPTPAPVVVLPAQPTTSVGTGPGPGSNVRAGPYYVVGSFARLENAFALVARQTEFAPAVVAARVDEQVRYRVVVGPFDRDRRAAVQRRLKRAGLVDAWALVLDASARTVAIAED